MRVRRWKRADVSTVLLCWAIHQHGFVALDWLCHSVGIPVKVLVAAVRRDADRGWVTWGVSVWRPFLDAQGVRLVQSALASLDPPPPPAIKPPLHP